MKRLLLSAAITVATAVPALADTDAVPARVLTPEQSEQCVTMMGGFPDDSAESRYVFFRLGQELAKDMTPELAQTMTDYMSENAARRLPADWPMIDVVEDIADPVLRKTAPEQTVAGMAHIAYFDALCAPFIEGQVKSLAAFDPTLRDADIYIREDALYLRQILSEALDRLGGGAAVDAYAQSLVRERDDIEFTGFEGEVADLEALYMGDLDTKLARSNDAVNENLNSEAFEDAVGLAAMLDVESKKKMKQDRYRSLARILNGYSGY